VKTKIESTRFEKRSTNSYQPVDTLRQTSKSQPKHQFVLKFRRKNKKDLKKKAVLKKKKLKSI